MPDNGKRSQTETPSAVLARKVLELAELNCFAENTRVTGGGRSGRGRGRWRGQGGSGARVGGSIWKEGDACLLAYEVWTLGAGDRCLLTRAVLRVALASRSTLLHPRPTRLSPWYCSRHNVSKCCFSCKALVSGQHHCLSPAKVRPSHLQMYA